ncbi:MAG: response regulator [Elusimicrobiota bacterium]
MAIDVIIVDDDPLVGELSYDLLTDAGFKAQWIKDSNLAIATVKKLRPKLVVLDILRPGIDGLTLLHTIKNDPEIKDTRAIVVSGKTFQAEIDRAKEYGADLFIQKPYDVKEFAAQVGKLIGSEPKGLGAGAQNPEEIEKAKRAVSFRVWGNPAAGSTPVCALEALDHLFVLDAGKGIIPLGAQILKEGKYKKLYLLLSHFHPDHISGLGLFPPLREKGFEIHIHGPKEPHIDLAGVLSREIKRSFKNNPEPVTASIQLHQVREDSYEIETGLRISPFYANHPSTTLGFLFSFAGRRIAYCPDSEIYGESATALQDYDEKIGNLVAGSDLLIHDARYTDADYANHKNEGHSSLTSTVGFAAEHDIKRLVLFHSDPSYSQSDLDAMEAQAVKLLDEKGSVIPCNVARDGLKLDF